MADQKIPTRKLNSGFEMPMLGYGTGTALFKSKDLDSLDEQTIEHVSTAIKSGFRHLDGAELYNNEAELGAAIARSGLPRSSFFITTKVVNSIADISKALDISLSKLGLDYVDLYLIHSPYFSGPSPSSELLQQKWRAMEECAKSGRARSIGVSNFLIPHLEAVLATAEIKPAVNQVEFHPYLQRMDLVPWSEKHGIVTSAFGPLTSITKGKPGPVDTVMERLAKKYDVTEEAVALRWCIDMGVIAITTSSKEKRMREYLAVETFQLTGEEVKEISEKGKEKHLRCNDFLHKYDANDRR